jgi:lysozyme
MGFEKLKERIKHHEGFRDSIYRDSLGKRTIGYGHLIVYTDDFKDGKKYSKEELEETFEKDFQNAVEGASRILDLDKLHPKAKEVAIECVFVLGASGFSRFKRCVIALEEQRYNDSSAELKDSLWFKQATNRVETLAKILEDL